MSAPGSHGAPGGYGAPGGPGAPRRGWGPLLVGAIAFAIVFLLILAGTIAYVMVRRSAAEARASESSRSAPATTGPSATDPLSGLPSADPSASATPGSAAPSGQAEYCWYNVQRDRSSVNPEGRIRGGALEISVPEGYTAEGSGRIAFADDDSFSSLTVEPGWIAVVGAGRIHWQDGYAYPGAQAASERLFDCMVNSSLTWGTSVSQRHLEDRATVPVTIDGVSGYRTSGRVVFDRTRLTTTTGTEVVLIVLDTAGGPSFFMADSAVGVEASAAGARAAEESLRVV